MGIGSVDRISISVEIQIGKSKGGLRLKTKNLPGSAKRPAIPRLQQRGKGRGS